MQEYQEARIKINTALQQGLPQIVETYKSPQDASAIRHELINVVVRLGSAGEVSDPPTLLRYISTRNKIHTDTEITNKALTLEMLERNPQFDLKRIKSVLSPRLCSANPVIAIENVNLESTGIPVSFIKNPEGTLEVTTDDNAEASYQAISKRVPVASGQTIKVVYDVSIAQGIMSFGLLATSRTAWYEPEVVLQAGNYKDSFTRVVPEGEIETTLVLRNYHLGVPGQTLFTLNKLQMEIQPIKKYIEEQSDEPSNFESVYTKIDKKAD